MNVLVSVVMSTYNDAEFIEEAISSILKQTHRNLEFLIVDDGSTDNTKELVERFRDPRIRFKSRENRGKVASLNEMLTEVKGDFIVMQDSDDFSRADRVEKLLRCFEEDEGLAMVLSGYNLIIDGSIVAPMGVDMDSAECYSLIEQLRVPSLDPTMMVRKEVACNLKFDSDFRIGQGVDFIFRVGERHRIRCLAEPIYNYRYNKDSVTKSNSDKKLDYIWKVFNSAKQRRGESELSFDEILKIVGNKRMSSDNNLSGHFSESVYQLSKKGRRLEALRVGFVSLKYLKRGMRFIKPAVYAVLPVYIVDHIKKRYGEMNSGK